MRPRWREYALSALVRKIAATLLVALVVAAASKPAEPRDGPAAARPQLGSDEAVDLEVWRETFRRPSEPVFADGTEDPLVRLGRHLFFERLLSGTGRMACSTCHDPANSFQDGRPRAVGVFYKTLSRRTPPLFDLAEVPALMRDGRARSLEEQVLMPVLDPNEMGQTLERLLEQLGRVRFYRDAFDTLFPGEGPSARSIAAALAAYVRSLTSPETAFDRWVEGDESALDDSERRGFMLFVGKAGCVACHGGWRLTDDDFHDIGLPDRDRGRGALFPDVEVWQHAFRTPSLRWVAARPPYMHDGSLRSLEAVIDHYDRGGVDRPSRSSRMRPLGLRPEEKADLRAFLVSVSRPAGPGS